MQTVGSETSGVSLHDSVLGLTLRLSAGGILSLSRSSVVSVNEEEVMGQLKISMEAATALTGIYREYFKREAKHRGRRVKAHT